MVEETKDDTIELSKASDNILLIKGDCIEELKKLKNASIDCITTSPPYWKGFVYEVYFNSYKHYLGLV